MAAKTAAKDYAENAQFLQDPPHLTLFVAQLTDAENWKSELRNILDRKISLNFDSWGSINDPITGKKTIISTVKNKDMLTKMQTEVAEFLREHKFGRAERYIGVTDPILNKNVEKYGFPFIGEIWIPHVTIGSFEPEMCDNIMELIQDIRPEGKYDMLRAAIIDVDEDYEEVDSWPLRNSIAHDVAKANRSIHENGLSVLDWGNASIVHRESGSVYIKPSGYILADVSEDDVVAVRIADGSCISGHNRPSVDTPTHIEIYKGFAEVGAIVHTHSTFATAFAQAAIPLRCLGTTHADCFAGPIPIIDLVADSDTYERDMGKAIVATFKEKGIDYNMVSACLLKHHGPMVWGKSIEEAVKNAIALEQIAIMNYHTLMLSTDVELPQKMLNLHHERKHGEKSYYGQK